MSFGMPPRTAEQDERSARLREMVRKLIEAFEKLTPEQKREERRQQMLSFVRGEAGMGSDADEAEYAQALREGDDVALHRLDEEAKLRVRRADEAIDRLGL